MHAWSLEGVKCRGGSKSGGSKCQQSSTYGAGGSAASASSAVLGSLGSPLGPTSAAGWAAVPSQFNWWHWLANEADSQRCPDD